MNGVETERVSIRENSIMMGGRESQQRESIFATAGVHFRTDFGLDVLFCGDDKRDLFGDARRKASSVLRNKGTEILLGASERASGGNDKRREESLDG